MGADEAKNQVNFVVNSVTNIIVNEAFSSEDNAGCFNETDFENCSDISNVHIDQHCYLQINVNALQDTNTQVKIDNSINSQIQQIANEVTQNLDANLKKNESENIINQVFNLSNSIQASYKTDCKINVNGENTFRCANSQNINNVWVAQDTLIDVVASCVQKNKQVIDSSAGLESAIKQSATLKVKNVLGIFFIFVMVVLAIVGWIVVEIIKTTGETTAGLQVFFIAVIILIALFFLLDCFYMHLIVCKKDTSGNDVSGNNTTFLNENINQSKFTGVQRTLINEDILLNSLNYG